MYRRIFTIASAFSLLICVVTIIERAQGITAIVLENEVSGSFYSISVPVWGLTLIALVLPTAYAFHFALIQNPRQTRARRWRMTGCCTRCGYDLTGNTSGVCPECGTAIEGAHKIPDLPTKPQPDDNL